jgi:hypothetical protein
MDQIEHFDIDHCEHEKDYVSTIYTLCKMLFFWTNELLSHLYWAVVLIIGTLILILPQHLHLLSKFTSC